MLWWTISQMNSSSPAIRSKAAQTLADSRERRAIVPITKSYLTWNQVAFKQLEQIDPAWGSSSEARSLVPRLLTELFTSQNRQRIADILVQIADTRISAALIQRLDPARSWVESDREFARRSLIRSGQGATDTIVAECGNAKPDYTVVLLGVLGEIKDPKAIPFLLQGLTSEHSSICTESFKALVKIGSAGTLTLLDYLERPISESTRIQIVGCLADIRDSRAVERIMPLLNHRSHKMRSNALAVINATGVCPEPSLLLDYLEDMADDVRKAALRAVGKFNPPGTAEGLLRMATTDSTEEIRSDAIGILATREGPEVKELLIHAAKVAQDERVQTVAMRALAKRADAATTELLIDFLRRGDSSKRRAVLHALKDSRDRGLIEPLCLALADKNNDVRQLAVAALGKFDEPQIIEPLVATLADSDATIRKSAVLILGKFTDDRIAKPLVTVLKDSSWEVCSAAAGILERIGIPETEEAVEHWRSCEEVHLLIRDFRCGHSEEEIRSAATELGKRIESYVERKGDQIILDNLVPHRATPPGLVSYTHERPDTLEWVVLAYLNDRKNPYRSEYRITALSLATSALEREWMKRAGIPPK